MFWPFQKLTRVPMETSHDESLESYISHATADGAYWDEGSPYGNAQHVTDPDSSNSKTTS
ncbi:hypothetical protein [Alicyclobacillus sp. SO9]|uniref:hypothetical protein n=1 Tax=Alicyclobacillus sp. SO9 TaxID=2665646 RepID=UPI0018E79698|nr:hypothetical protein [Alicyclobacillus sp. SO9]QQE77177.1 hypothetical protein GI364_14505 [Alicyclobacillus sp. SO9]